MTSKILSILFFSFFILSSFTSSTDPILKKRITDKEFKYEFFVTPKKPEIKSDRVYYWFKGGAIHTSEYGISGELLNDDFEKFYLSNQLAEKGQFKKGLKIGVWKTWHPNGVLETSIYYNEGLKKGTFYKYTDKGVLLEKGRYRSNKKQGKWINYNSNDTLVYKNDKIVIPKNKKSKKETEENASPEQKKPGFFKKMFTKTKKNETVTKEDLRDKKNQSQKKKEKVKETKSKKGEVTEEKKGFFNRLFSKKKK